jgi:flagellar basal body L-ring protein FlgH
MEHIMKTLIMALLLLSSVSMADIIQQQPINYEAQEQELKQQQVYTEQEMLREEQEANKVLKQQKQQVQELYQNIDQQTFGSDGNHSKVSGQ